jgi:hypothetical protein
MGALTFRDRLADLRRSCAPFYGFGVDTFHPVTIRPCLGFAMVPKPRRKPDPEPAREIQEALLQGTLLPTTPQADGLGAGLVDGEKFDATPDPGQARRGLAGLSAAGKFAVEDLCSLVRQDRGCYGMWTVTLPQEAAEHLDRIPDGFQKFQDTIRRRFGEAHRRACLRDGKAARMVVPAHWWYVVEPQSSGRPHMHMVFRCKARRGRSWLLGKAKLDGLIRAAFVSVCGVPYPVKAAGNVQALRSDPGRYLSKYLRKSAYASSAEKILDGGWGGNLIPHQWWGCSREALRFAESFRFPLPAFATGWLSLKWPEMTRARLLKAGIFEPAGLGAPRVVTGRFFGIDGLEGVMRALFELGEVAYPTGRTFGYT